MKVTHAKRCPSLVALAVLVAMGVLPGSDARADVIALQDRAASEASLLHQWTFEGPDTAAQRADKKGSADLSVIRATGSIAPEPNSVPGFGNIGLAVQSIRGVQPIDGSGLRSGSFTLPEQGTVEFLFQPNSDNSSHMISTAGAGTNRLYFHLSGSNSTGFGLGNSASWFGGALSGATNPNYENGHWYYAAVVYDHSTNSSRIDYTIHVADLTEGQKTLPLTPLATGSKDANTSVFGNNGLGIGAPNSINPLYNQFFDGQLDEVAYYDQKLSPAAIQGHLNVLSSQNAPVLWLKADALNLADGDAVSTWTASAGPDATAPSSPTAAPTFKTNVLNSDLPVVRFDGVDDLLSIPGFANTYLAGTEFTALMVSKSTDSSFGFSGNAANGGGALPRLYLTRASFSYDTNATLPISLSGVGSAATIHAFTHNGLGDGSGQLAAFLNGAPKGTAAKDVVAAFGGGGSLAIPFQASSVNHPGDMAEIILYNRVLNSAERQIAENYLSSKYDITINAAYDRYHGDDAAHGDFDRDVFGIGRLADGAQTSAAVAALALAEREASLDPGDFVLAGHGSPAANPWEQTWYVDVTGSVAADLTFDVSGGFSGPTADMFGLLYNATDPLALSRLAISPLVNGDRVTFALAEGQLLSGYYALYVVPEPSTLLLLFAAGLALVFTRRCRLAGS